MGAECPLQGSANSELVIHPKLTLGGFSNWIPTLTWSCFWGERLARVGYFGGCQVFVLVLVDGLEENVGNVRKDAPLLRTKTTV